MTTRVKEAADEGVLMQSYTQSQWENEIKMAHGQGMYVHLPLVIGTQLINMHAAMRSH